MLIIPLNLDSVLLLLHNSKLAYSVKPLKSLYENEAWVNFVMIGMHAGELIENSKVLPKI